MLAPDDIDPILGALNGFHANVHAADSIASVFDTFNLYPVQNEAVWITRFRERLPDMYKTSRDWQMDRINILPSIISPFITYHNKFSSMAAYLTQAENGRNAASMLDRLIHQIEKNVIEATAAKNKFTGWVRSAKLHVDFMEESIKQAWYAIGGSEKKITQLSEQIINIQNSISTLSGVISLNSVSEGVVGRAKDVLSGTASMVYSVAVQGMSLPILSVGVTFFTLGKMFHDIFKTASQIERELENLKKYRFDLTLEQISLAQTKSALMYVYEMKSMLELQNNTLREMETFWQNELRNVSTVRENFALTEAYEKRNPEVLQLPIAQSVWFSLREHSQDILTGLNNSTDTGTVISFAL